MSRYIVDLYVLGFGLTVGFLFAVSSEYSFKKEPWWRIVAQVLFWPVFWVTVGYWYWLTFKRDNLPK